MKSMKHFLLLACIVASLQGADKPSKIEEGRSGSFSQQSLLQKEHSLLPAPHRLMVDTKESDIQGKHPLVNADGKVIARVSNLKYPFSEFACYSTDENGNIVSDDDGQVVIVRCLVEDKPFSDWFVATFENERRRLVLKMEQEGVSALCMNVPLERVCFVEERENNFTLPSQLQLKKSLVATQIKKWEKKFGNLTLSDEYEARNYLLGLAAQAHKEKERTLTGLSVAPDYAIADVELEYWNAKGKRIKGKVPFYVFPEDNDQIKILQSRVAKGGVFLTNPLIDPSITEIQEGQG